MNKQVGQGAPQCGVSQQSPAAAATTSFAQAAGKEARPVKKAAAVIA